jgi:protein TonB
MEVVMFTRLLESGSKTRRHQRWLSASTGLHVIILAGAVTLTPQREISATIQRDSLDIVWLGEPVRDRRVPRRPSDRSSPRGEPRPRNRMPVPSHLPNVPGIDVQPVNLGTDIGDDGGAEGPGDGLLTPGEAEAGGAGDHGARSIGTVEKVAVPLPGNAQPVYPERLRSAGIEGSVVLRFVVDTSGRVEPGSMRVLQADHELFASAVRTALAKHRFIPAEVSARRVRMLVEQRFDFAIGR